RHLRPRLPEVRDRSRDRAARGAPAIMSDDDASRARSSRWSTERIAAQYRAEIRGLFEAENAAWRAEEEASFAEVQRDHPDRYERLIADTGGVRDSHIWDIYVGSDVQIRMNDVRVVLRDGFAIFPDLIEMFGRASVVWTSPSVGAEVVAGEARLVIDLL